MLCYFCKGKGHGTKNCPSYLSLIDKGILIKWDGTNQYMLKDGGYIPRDDDNGSSYEKVLRIAQEKGWTNDTQGVLFYEDPEDDENNIQFYQAPVEVGTISDSPPDEDMIELAKQMYKVFMKGMDEEDRGYSRDVADNRSKN